MLCIFLKCAYALGAKNRDARDRALFARVNGWANASDSFQETFEEAKYYLGERYEQLQTHLYRHIQALPHVQYAGKPAHKTFSMFIDKNYRGTLLENQVLEFDEK